MKYNKTFRQALNEVRTGNLKEQEGQRKLSWKVDQTFNFIQRYEKNMNPKT